MKKITLAVVALAASFALAGCASDDASTNTTSSAAATSQTVAHKDMKGEMHHDTKGETAAQ
jgi:hypothetical protein